MPRRILIVEDDTSIAQTLTLALRSIPDVQIERAYDGEAALALWNTSPAHIVVTDNHMREMSGLELTRHLRRSGAREPILMITAYDSVALQREAREAGVTQLIAKPFFIDELIDQVALLLPDSQVTA
ncbi:MAG TPA: response regulator [Herpetosiphonaceae bacterium]